MNKGSSYILLALFIAVLGLGVGFAAISNITLTISGNATATASSENWKVCFTGTPSVTKNPSTVVATSIVSTTDCHTATFDVSNMTAYGDYAQTVITIANQSTGITSNLEASCALAGTDKAKFVIDSCTLADSSILAGGTTTLTVKVRSLATPVTTGYNATIAATIVASPVVGS